MTAAFPSSVPHVTATSRLAALRIPPAVVLSLAVVALVIAWSLVPGLFTSYDPVNGVPAHKLLAPSAQHWFGTDQIGRDLYARVVYGTASSITSALIAVSIGVVAGGFIGLLAGFLGGWVDIVFARLMDVLLAIPSFLLAVIIVTALGFDTTNVAIATGLSAVAVFARVMRSEVIKARQATSVLTLAVLQFGLSILVIASLAFLGYGDPPPASDWGLLISIGKNYLKWPWLVYAPAFVTIATVLSVNRISRWLRKTA